MCDDKIKGVAKFVSGNSNVLYELVLERRS